MKEYNVYIDESGDEGLHRGSKFFILTAILVEKEKDLGISKCVDIIKENLEINIKSQLHWNTIKGYPNKIMIMSNIKDMELTIINIVIDTSKIRFINSNDIYNHFSGYLYERICWFVRDKNCVANINISSRGENLSKENLTTFLKEHNEKFKIDYSRIKQIKIYPNSQKKLLQLADCCCSALGQALKYSDDKHHKYIYYLKDKLYEYNKKFLGYGLKYVPGNITPAKEFQELIIYLQNKKT
jgi:hypothetical protein